MAAMALPIRRRRGSGRQTPIGPGAPVRGRPRPWLGRAPTAARPATGRGGPRQADVSRPISRVLSGELPLRDGHSSGVPLAQRLEQPTRAAAGIGPGAPGARNAPNIPRRPYSVLLPVGFAVPPPSPEARCALTAPFHPCRCGLPRAGGLFSVALSLGSPPAAVSRHRDPWSPDFPPPDAEGRKARVSGSGRPASWQGQ
jgi:hypothetical protein